MTNAEQTMIATLQGLISLKSEDQIYILSSNEPYYKIWLEDLNKIIKLNIKQLKTHGNLWINLNLKLMDMFYTVV